MNRAPRCFLGGRLDLFALTSSGDQTVVLAALRHGTLLEVEIHMPSAEPR